MPGLTKKTELLLLVIILLVAAFLRLWRLDQIPPGLTHDEADTGYFVAAVYRGAPSAVETPYGYANEPFTMYSGALFMALFGPTDLALRVHSAFFGLLLVFFTYLWARRAFGVVVALVAAALLAVSYWAVSNSRFAVNSEPAPALFTGAIFFLWVALHISDRDLFQPPFAGATERINSLLPNLPFVVATSVARSAERLKSLPPKNLKTNPWWAWALFSLCLAGSLYTYEAARAAAVALIVFFLYLALFHRSLFRRRGLGFAAALAVAGLLAAPHLLDPGAWQRSSTLSEPLNALLQGDLGPIMSNVGSALATFNLSGDSFVTYNLPGRPIFDPVVSLFFFAGFALCIWYWKRPGFAFVLLWVAAGVAPSLVIGEWTSTLHSKGAIAPLMSLPALGIVYVGRYVLQRFGAHWARLVAAAGVGWLLVVALFTLRDYFFRWGPAPETRAAYFHNLAAITDYVDRLPPYSVVALSSPFPDQPLDPFIGAMRVQRQDITLRWFNGRRAILLPSVDASKDASTDASWLILPTSAPLVPELADWVPLASAERVFVNPEDVDPYFDVLRWRPDRAWETALVGLSGTQVAGGSPLGLPVNFGGAIQLVGYDLRTPSIAPGEPVTLITAWQVLEPETLGPLLPQRYGRSAAIFVHMRDPSGNVAGQEDRLDVPAWNWQPGDRFVQLHRFLPSPGLPPGTYTLALGVYTLPEVLRLPIQVEDGSAGDHVTLQPVELSAP